MTDTNLLFQKVAATLKKAKHMIFYRHSAILAHPIAGGKILAGFVPDLSPTETDVGYAKRLLTAYELVQAHDSVVRPNDIWTAIAKRQQQSFFDVLTAGDPQQLAAYLCNMSRSDATHGTVQGAVEYRRLKRSAYYRRFIARMAKDKLVSLAEAVGAIPCENPEQGSWGHTFSLEPLELVERIKKKLGVDITPPPIDGGLFKINCGVNTDAPRFGERDCNAIYTGWTLGKLLAENASSAAVCEIGGGSGRVAYWATRFGIRNYTIYDLPHINVVQGFYLMKALGGKTVRLYGEDGADDIEGIRVLPYFTCEKVKKRCYDLVLNQDSFPEIHANIVRDYLAWMKHSARTFLSINHESEPNSVDGALQNNVSDLVRECESYSLLSRQLYWLRKGYVMELYRIS